MNPTSAADGKPNSRSINAFFDRARDAARDELQGRARTLDERLGRGDRKWHEMLDEARHLGEHLAGEPRVAYFGVGLHDEEIAVKVAHSPGPGHSYFILSHHQPDGQTFALEVVWLREIGQPDKCFEDPLEALRELAKRIARQLA